MAPPLAAIIFCLSVALTLSAAGYFADRLDHLGPRLGLPEALVGLLTALAADGPEISSALIALAQGSKAVSIGVVLGSNVFNLAAMVGLSALLAGAIHLGHRALAIEGAVGMIGALIAAGLILDLIPAAAALAAFAAIIVPYVILLARRPAHPDRPARRLPAPTGEPQAMWKLTTLIVCSVVLIVVGSVGMVSTALSLADRWHIPEALVGVLILAALTSLPNAFTAVRLGTSDRGTALVSETLNSNTINLLGGVMVPALVVGLAAPSGLVKFDLAWLVMMTTLTLIVLARPGGARRPDGALLIALYLTFVGVQIAHA